VAANEEDDVWQKSTNRGSFQKETISWLKPTKRGSNQ
jgi:hypothetical protein